MYMATVISVLNNKGGTGKTTTSFNLSVALARRKKKVLVADFDSQCNLSSAFGIFNPEKHIGHLLLKHEKVDNVISRISNVSVIPSSEKLLDYEMQLNSEPGRDYLLRESIREEMDNYDFIIFDCPPSLGLISINTLVAADFYIVPMQTEHFAFIGLDSILHTCDKVRERLNPSLELGGILFIRYSPRTKFTQAVISSLQEHNHLRDKIFETKIRQDISVMESTAFNQSVFEYSPKSRGAQDYGKFAKEIIHKYGRKK